jgi:LemA protein
MFGPLPPDVRLASVLLQYASRRLLWQDLSATLFRQWHSTHTKGAVSMNPLVITLIVVVVILFLLAIWIVGMYNGLVALRNRFKNAYSQIDVQLKRRYDLIPNLVEVAKGYIKHERETLEAVIKARNAAYAAGQQAASNPGERTAMTALGGAEGQLTGALGRLFAVAEAYPDLKANQNMMALQEELSSTENKVAFARQAYNDSVMVYNTQREVFPTVIIASMFNFQEAHLFEVEQAQEREAPKVSFTS